MNLPNKYGYYHLSSNNTEKTLLYHGPRGQIFLYFAYDGTTKIQTRYYKERETEHILSTTSYKLISKDEFLSYYRKALGYTDEILNTRGVLINPDELDKRLSVDELGRITIKY